MSETLTISEKIYHFISMMILKITIAIFWIIYNRAAVISASEFVSLFTMVLATH